IDSFPGTPQDINGEAEVALDVEMALAMAPSANIRVYEMYNSSPYYDHLMTRIATQRLKEGEGDERAALASLFKLWELLREALKAHPGCTEFAKLAIPFFNQRLRPFTARWHRRDLSGAFTDPAACREFRVELEQLRQEILHFTGMLSEIAAVEDLRPALMAD
ncbi:MAG TPA: hypothetical protein PKW90_09680, partial [Myxococcota bacterium]|nr:hypothetical protein [Myxococcota bacterium]